MELDLRGELRIGGTWVDVTGNMLKRQRLTHIRGRRDQGARVDPSACRPLLNNTDGQFSPDNPLSPYYGEFGRNTPFRLSLRAGSPALDLPGSVGDHTSTPDNAALDIVGDIDVRLDATLSNWMDATDGLDTVEMIGKFTFAGGGRSWVLGTRFNRLYFEWSADGTATFAASSTADVPLPASGRMAVRVTMDVDNGASGRTITFFTAPTMAGPWTQLGSTVVQSGTTSIFNSTTVVKIGDATDTAFTRPVGRVHKAEIRNGINGTLVANPDFTAQTVGATSFVDGAGRTWTVNGTTSISNRHTRLSHELAAYPTRWHPSGKHVWVEAQTAGILRRLRRGSTTLDSTLRRRIPSGSPLAYWPMEDGASGTQFYSPIPGVRPLRMTGMDLASEDSLAGSSALPVIRTGATLAGTVPAPSGSPTQWHTEFVFLSNAPATARSVLFYTSTGTVQLWRLMLDAGGAQIYGYDADGNTVTSQLVALTALGVFGAWTRWQLYATQSGGTVNYTIRWVPIGGAGGSISDSYSGTVGRIAGVRSPDGYGSELDGLVLGHIGVFSTANTLIYNSADLGFAGETAGARMQRLVVEENLPLTVCGVVTEQEQVGPQRPDAVLDLLEEAADADGGILYEDREQPALRYRDRAGMYNQTPAVVLDYNAPGLAPPLEPTGDDDATENDVTVTRVNGSSGHAVLEEGALSVQAPPNGVGPYPASASLNLHSDEQAEPIAYWRMHLGTYEGRRYPQVHVMVHQAPPEVVDQILATDIGDKMVIKNPPPWLAPGDIELLVQGYEETFDEFAWDIVFNCTPAGPWNVGVADDPLLARADTAGSELAGAVDADDATLTVLTTADLPWITANPQLNANADFETSLTGWGGSGGTIARVPTLQPAPFTGTWSLQFTPNGVAEFPNAGSTTMPVTVGQQYVASGWLRSATARSLALNINWFTTAGAYLSTSANDVTVEAGEWTWFELTATAPATALTANLAATVPDFPPATDVLWGDQITLRPAGGSPSDFPFDIRAGGEVMTVTAISDEVRDTFTRTTATGWQTADSGQTWTGTGGLTSDHYTQGSRGVHRMSAVSTSLLDLITATGTDHDVRLSVSTDQLATGGDQYVAAVCRATADANLYMAQLQFSTAAGVTLTLRKRVSTAETTLGTFATGLTHTALGRFFIRIQAAGSLIRCRAWASGSTEPTTWQISVTDTSLTSGSGVGARSVRTSANTNANLVANYDDVELLNPQRFTVIRSRNNVVKSHATTTDVRLAYPTIVAL